MTEKKTEDSTLAVQLTSDDAAVSKLSASRLGYFKDDFLQYFVAPQTHFRSPLINRGYYARVTAVRAIIDEFLKAGGPETKKQILSLGAGMDTQYFRLKSTGQAPHKYFEVDFAKAMNRKAEIISQTRVLSDLMHAGEPATAEPAPAAKPEPESFVFRKPATRKNAFRSADFALIGCDLRNVEELEAKLTAAGMDFTLPTLLLSECVLVYIKPEYSAAVIGWASRKLTGGGVFVTYEQIHPHDPFGQTMMKNLASRGCHLLGLERYPDLKSQEERFLGLGWQRHAAWDMNDVYKYYLPRADVRRIERIELFDEFEEWHLINAHYCVSMASKEPDTKKSDSAEGAGAVAPAEPLFASIGLIGRAKIAPPDDTPPLDIAAIRAKFMKAPEQKAPTAAPVAVALDAKLLRPREA